MSGVEDLRTLVVELRRTLTDLEETLEPRTAGGLPRPPTAREFARFTSDVAIPGAILVLRVNVETLRLLQRTLRMADGRSPAEGARATDVGRRARDVSRATLDRLDDALGDLQAAVEGTPPDDEARELLERARSLREEVDARLVTPTVDDGRSETDVPVDIDAELRSIRRAVDEQDGPDDASSDGPSGGDDARDDGPSGGDDASSEGPSGGDDARDDDPAGADGSDD